MIGYAQLVEAIDPELVQAIVAKLVQAIVAELVCRQYGKNWVWGQYDAAANTIKG